MSRYQREIEEGVVAFGYDPMSGYFLQLFNYKGDMILEMESNPFFKDQTPVNRVHIAEYLTALGVEIEFTDRIILDLPI